MCFTGYHYFLWYPTKTASFMEKSILSSLNCKVTFVLNQMTNRYISVLFILLHWSICPSLYQYNVLIPTALWHILPITHLIIKSSSFIHLQDSKAKKSQGNQLTWYVLLFVWIFFNFSKYFVIFLNKVFQHTSLHFFLGVWFWMLFKILLILIKININIKLININ